MDLLGRHLRTRLETHLADAVGRALGDCRSAAGRAAPQGPLVAAIGQFVMSGGKRVRPQLCCWTYLAAKQEAEDSSADDAFPAALMDVACAWELFHAFLLCHDDIIDRADRRRGLPTLHHRLASLDGGSRRFGADLGIVAGDLLFAGAMRLLHELDLGGADGGGPAISATTYQRVLRLFSRVGCETGFGQAIDIIQGHVPLGEVDERVVIQGYYWKTAAYTFEGPMLSGATLAGLDEAACRAVSRFALAVGQAYQVHNDLLDLSSEAHAGCDLVQGKRTPTLLRARLSMTPAGRRDLDRQVSEIASAATSSRAVTTERAVELAESLRQDLLAGGAADATRESLDALLADAAAAARDDAVPPGLSAGMSGLLAGMSADYFASALVPSPPCTQGGEG